MRRLATRLVLCVCLLLVLASVTLWLLSHFRMEMWRLDGTVTGMISIYRGELTANWERTVATRMRF